MRKILVVDDNPSNREILRLRLERAGYGVEEAADGEAALDVAYAQVFDLFILDVLMPKLDGWHVCRSLKENPKTKSIPVVMMTALGQPAEEARRQECHADAYLSKPWELTQLLSLLTKLLPAAEGS